MPEIKLNQSQKKAAHHKDGPLLIIAGAGTGKTTVLIERLLHLTNQKLAQSSEILLLTFTEKAASEIEDRALMHLPYGSFDLWIYTFHGFCERILRESGIDIGLNSDFRIISQTEQWILIKKNLARLKLNYYRPLGNPHKFISELVKYFSRLKDENISVQKYLDFSKEKISSLKSLSADPEQSDSGAEGQRSDCIEHKKKVNLKDPSTILRPGSGTYAQGPEEIVRIQELARAYEIYNQLLCENNFLDFGDLINYTIQLFRTRPQILARYQAQFKYTMVDEFQDTNWSQYELIQILTYPKNNLCVVGDDDQAIYKFRGASLANIMQFKNDYPDAEEIILDQNYRSTQAILDASYNFIQHNNPNRLEEKLKINKKLIAAKTDQDEDKIDLDIFASQDDETQNVISKIIEFYKKEKNINWSDFAILLRANNTADRFCAELKRQNVPFVFMSHRGLYYKPEILDFLAFLKLLINYHDTSALFRVLNMEIFKIQSRTIINLNRFARRKVLSLFETLEKTEAIEDLEKEEIAKINSLLKLIKSYSQLASQKKASFIFLKFIRESRMLNQYDRDRDLEFFSLLNQFYSKIKNFEETNPDALLRDFLDLIELEMEAGETGSLRLDFTDHDTVRVMTVHSAKGLEFDYVFLPDLADKRFPTISRRDQIPLADELIHEELPDGTNVHTEEERRLFYVALTRARKYLSLSYARDCGGAREKKPSLFLRELNLWDLDKRLARAGDLPQSTQNMRVIKDLWQLDTPQNENQIQNYNLPTRFSFSQIEAYNNCPLQYKFNFILKIPIPTKANFIFGRLMHNTLRDFLKPLICEEEFAPQKSLFHQEDFALQPQSDNQNTERILSEAEAEPKDSEVILNNPSINTPQLNLAQFQGLLGLKNLMKLYQKNWQNDGYASKEERAEYKQKGEAILNDFHARLSEAETLPQILFLEKVFTAKISTYLFRGAIDRVDLLSDGTLEIIDYKTGNPKEKLVYQEKRQLILYKIVGEELFRRPVSQLSFYYLENNTKLSFEVKDKEVEKLKLEIKETIEKIMSRNFNASPSLLCKYCDFSSICEFGAGR